MKFLMSGKPLKGGAMIDTYNQQVQYDVACTIRTNINTANHHFIIEEMEFKGREIHPYESFYWDTTTAFFRGELGGGIARCVKTDDSLATLVVEYEENPDNPSERGKSNGKYKQRIEMNKSGVVYTITSVQKDSMVAEPRIINPLKGQSDNGWHFEQQVYDAEGIARAVKAGEGSGNIPKVIEPLCSVHPNSHKLEFNPETSIKPISPALRATDYKAPHCVYEPLRIPEATAQGYAEAYEGDSVNLAVPNSKTRRGRVGKQMANTLDTGCQQGVVVKDEEWQTVVGSKQINSFRDSVDGQSPCITSACGAGGGMTPMVTDADLETTKTKEFIEQVRGHEEMRYRIRKLTPRECFRLMGVDDKDIDKIQASGISNSQQYKLAGNSIVVDVLYHLFRKMFVETENENDQLCLF